MAEIEIQGRKIGSDHEPLVVAEIGINHGGDLQVAFEMVDAAKSAGVEIIKHQTHIVEDEMSAAAKTVVPGNARVSIHEIISQCALTEFQEKELQRYVNAKGIIFISTPFSRAAANRLQNMKVPAFKIGSGECNNYPLVEHIARFRKPIILSTGMNEIASVTRAVEIIRTHRAPYALLHTTSVYPTPDHLVRLGAMLELASAFPGTPYGLSDHTTTNHACFGAVASGASIVERHFTDHMNREGPDIVCSMDIQACTKLIEGCKILAQQRGGQKRPLEEEQATIEFAFASVVTIKQIYKGDRLTTDNIWVKRPGSGGIPAGAFQSILGKTAIRDVAPDTQLQYCDFD